MRRRHLIEIHEQSWYPDSWRRLFQLGMGLSISLTGAFDNIVDPFRRFLDRVRPETVLDLCSGSGEAAVSFWAGISSQLQPHARPSLTLSDLYPVIPAYSRLKEQHPDLVDFYPESVDALHPPADAPKVRMMLDALHHFRPDDVRQILSEAADSADGFAALEVTGRTWKNMLTVPLVPLVSAIITAFLVHPRHFRNVLWGLLIPVIPLQTMFDGAVSNLRTYTVAELREMTRALDRPDFAWEIGTAPIPKTPLRATYLFGWRTSLDRSAGAQNRVSEAARERRRGTATS